MRKTNKWVACWGYDQTQYSIYEEVSRKGSFVVVRGYNEWACLHESDLYDGSKVKLYKVDIPYFHDIPEAEREIIAKKFNWDANCATSYDFWESSRRYEYRKRKEEAKVHTIKKVTHETDEEGYRYWVWLLDDGQVIKGNNREWEVEIVDALVRKKIRKTNYFGEEEESIKINECIRAHLDKNFDKNAQKYEEQNEYTFYHGR